MPFVHEIIEESGSINSDILSTIFSKIILGVAIKIISAFSRTSFKLSEATIFSDSFNSGWYEVFAPSELILKAWSESLTQRETLYPLDAARLLGLSQNFHRLELQLYLMSSSI